MLTCEHVGWAACANNLALPMQVFDVTSWAKLQPSLSVCLDVKVTMYGHEDQALTGPPAPDFVSKDLWNQVSDGSFY